MGTCVPRLFVVTSLIVATIASAFTLYMEYLIHEMTIIEVSITSFLILGFMLFLYKCQFGQCSFGQPETCWGGVGGVITIISCKLNYF